jgi:hypothetical protein
MLVREGLGRARSSAPFAHRTGGRSCACCLSFPPLSAFLSSRPHARRSNKGRPALGSPTPLPARGGLCSTASKSGASTGLLLSVVGAAPRAPCSSREVCPSSARFGLRCVQPALREGGRGSGCREPRRKAEEKRQRGRPAAGEPATRSDATLSSLSAPSFPFPCPSLAPAPVLVCGGSHAWWCARWSSRLGPGGSGVGVGGKDGGRVWRIVPEIPFFVSRPRPSTRARERG